MQVRIANRQDEAAVRALLQAQGETLELTAGGKDNDLHNLDQDYFGHEGLFIVAEDEGKILAFAGARKSAENPRNLRLQRLHLPAEAPQNLRQEFLTIIKNFAYQMDFEKIEAEAELLS